GGGRALTFRAPGESIDTRLEILEVGRKSDRHGDDAEARELLLQSTELVHADEEARVRRGRLPKYVRHCSVEPSSRADEEEGTCDAVVDLSAPRGSPGLAPRGRAARARPAS